MPSDLATTLKQTLSEWQKARFESTGQTFDKLVVGAAVFLSDVDGKPCILVAKRAATEHYLPNHFEMPGGKVDPGETIEEGLARELFEETSLRLSKVCTMLPEFTYTTERTVLEDGKTITSRKTSCQLNFAVQVELGAIKLNDEEHSEWTWASEKRASELRMTELMHECVGDALAWAKEQ